MCVLTLIFTSTQVFFSMLEIYNEQVRSAVFVHIFWRFLSLIIFFLSLLFASRCLTCWFGALVHQGLSGSERNSTEASTWRDYEQSRVKVRPRYRETRVKGGL